MITISGYSFAGPYTSTASLEDKSGVYAILTRPATGGSWTVLDVGESAEVKSRVETHDRKNCWTRNSKTGGLAYAVFYTPGKQQAGRREIEQAIRKAMTLPCGEQ